MPWKEISDKDVQHFWECEEPQSEYCKGEVVVTPEWYADNGTPVCTGCDRDMIYVRTEVNID